ncbi:hypothetical protein MPLDJ20_260161 [Mesorhizobium plurifarium]|uniref:Uncharacterized protein n=1 Tax=Mesorhizobium plurifarium TaxID=69974 RepID=A0A090F7Q1_MESPL|nr:hypothetical protein MPLDJ20_260161 [Mesorhizobium plurifarium]
MALMSAFRSQNKADTVSGGVSTDQSAHIRRLERANSENPVAFYLDERRANVERAFSVLRSIGLPTPEFGDHQQRPERWPKADRLTSA